MVNKIKILYVTDTFPPHKDGVVTFMMETYKRLSGKFDISFLAPNIEDAELNARTMNLNVTFLPVRKIKINNYPLPHPKSKIITFDIGTKGFFSSAVPPKFSVVLRNSFFKLSSRFRAKPIIINHWFGKPANHPEQRTKKIMLLRVAFFVIQK